MPNLMDSGVGSVLITFARTEVPSQSMIPDTNGTGIPGAAWATMVKVRSVPSSATRSVPELGSEAGRTGVAPPEVAGPARRALLGDEVGIVAEHQIVDQRNLICHHAPEHLPRPAAGCHGARFDSAQYT